MARTKQTARREPKGKTPRKSHASKGAKSSLASELDKLTGTEVLARLRLIPEYKDMSDYAIKKYIGQGKLATVQQLKDRLEALTASTEEDEIEEVKEEKPIEIPTDTTAELINQLTNDLCSRFRKLSKTLIETATDKNKNAWIATLEGFGDDLANYEGSDTLTIRY